MFLYRPKNSPNWYVGGVPDGDKKKRLPLHKFLRLSFPVRTKTEAQRLLASYRRQEIEERTRGLPGSPTNMTAEQFYRAYEQDCQRNKMVTTLRSDNYRLRRWLSFLKDQKVRSPAHITRTLVNQFIQELPGRSNRTVNRYVSFIRASLRWGLRRGYLETNALRDFSRLKETRQVYVTELSAEEVEKLFSVPDPAFRLFLQVVYYTLARKGEILSLTWSDVDLKRKLITFRQTKTGRPRKIPIADRLLEELKQIPAGNGQLFPWKPEYVSRKYQRLRDRLDLKPEGIHRLRHARASELLRKGVNPRAVQEMLGHSTSRTTMEIYAFVSVDGLREAVNK